MSDKKWKPIDWEDCHLCGDDAEVFTDQTKPGWVCDGDDARCVSCDNTGVCQTPGDGNAHISWKSEQ